MKTEGNSTELVSGDDLTKQVKEFSDNMGPLIQLLKKAMQ